MEEALRALLPKMLGSVTTAFYPFPGKPALLRRLPDRLRSYRRWLPKDWRLLVVVDRDRDDCKDLKNRLEREAVRAGLSTRSSNPTGSFSVIKRIAIEELEAWYFGDWQAVRAAYPDLPASIPNRARFRDPDAIAGGTWEAFQGIMQQAGYFLAGLNKTEVARQVAPQMDPARNNSRSFQVLRDALSQLVVR